LIVTRSIVYRTHDVSRLIENGGNVQMATKDKIDELLEHYHGALAEFLKGNPEPVRNMFSQQADVTLANPLSPPLRGWGQVAPAIDYAASVLREGEIVGIEQVMKSVTPELAYVVQIERSNVKVPGREDMMPTALRVTMIFRPEDGVWKVVHRHADPMNMGQPSQSTYQR
jgi:ketosteroid isomerase-like protein